MQTGSEPQSARRFRTEWIAGGAVTAVLTLFFFLLFWNHFAGLRSGNGSFGNGSSFLAGKLPYRDYFSATPPMTALESAAVLYCFGNKAIVMRGFGVVERIVLACLIYLWLSRLFRPADAAMAAVATIILSAGDVSDPVSSYNHDTILWAVASGFAASFALDRLRTTPGLFVSACISGALAGLVFASKQTIGVGITAGIPIAVSAGLLRLDGKRRAAVFIAGFAAGWIICTSALVAWLAHLGNLREFIQDVFVRGPAAKASAPTDFLVRYLLFANYYRLATFIGLGAALLLIPILRRSGRTDETGTESRWGWIWVFAVNALAVVLGIVASRRGVQNLGSLKPVIYVVIYATTIWLVMHSIGWIRTGLSRRESQYYLFATVSFVAAFMLALSWPAFEAMIVPGLALLIAAALHVSRGWWRPAIYIVCAYLVTVETCAKLENPFAFADWSEPPVSEATAVSTFPQLAGFVLPISIVRFIDGTLRIIEENSSSTDTIFTYPELGLFYGLSGRTYPTFTGSHNIDVVDDGFASREAKRLLEQRPAVLIFYRQDEAFLEAEEILWRRGNRAGQRDLIEACETLAREYRLAGSFDIPPKQRRVDVYVRP